MRSMERHQRNPSTQAPQPDPSSSTVPTIILSSSFPGILNFYCNTCEGPPMLTNTALNLLCCTQQCPLSNVPM